MPKCISRKLFTRSFCAFFKLTKEHTQNDVVKKSTETPLGETPICRLLLHVLWMQWKSSSFSSNSVWKGYDLHIINYDILYKTWCDNLWLVLSYHAFLDLLTWLIPRRSMTYLQIAGSTNIYCVRCQPTGCAPEHSLLLLNQTVGVTAPRLSINARFCKSTSLVFSMTFTLDRCLRNQAAETPAKYEINISEATSVLRILIDKEKRQHSV